jgi:hypothetical protein
MERGVTARRPTSDATLERVAILAFLLRFAGGGPSVPSGWSSATDDGDVNINLNA